MRAHLAWLFAVLFVAVLAWLFLRRAYDAGETIPSLEKETAAEVEEARLVGSPLAPGASGPAPGAPAGYAKVDWMGEGAGQWWIPELYALDVTICDAETGQALEGVSWTTRPYFLTSYARSFSLRVTPPPGYVAWDQRYAELRVPSWVRKIEFVYPLRREIEAWVTMQPRDGRRLVEPGLSWRIGLQRSRGVPVTVNRVRVRGIPFLPGAAVFFHAVDGDHYGGATIHIPDREGIPLEARIWLDPSPPTEPEIEIEPVIRDVEITDHVETEEDSVKPKLGALSLRVFRRDGSPAAHVAVKLGGSRWGTTDAEGQVRFDRVEEGKRWVRVRVAGLIPITEKIAVYEGRVTEQVLQEPEGATLRVEVVDAEGRPRPFAAIHIHQPGGDWIDVRGDTTRVDPFTDEQGRRQCEHVEPGQVQVIARWGDKRGSAYVEVHAGETVPVRIEIP